MYGIFTYIYSPTFGWFLWCMVSGQFGTVWLFRAVSEIFVWLQMGLNMFKPPFGWISLRWFDGLVWLSQFGTIWNIMSGASMVFFWFLKEDFGSFNFVGDRWFSFAHCFSLSICHLAEFYLGYILHPGTVANWKNRDSPEKVTILVVILSMLGGMG